MQLNKCSYRSHPDSPGCSLPVKHLYVNSDSPDLMVDSRCEHHRVIHRKSGTWVEVTPEELKDLWKIRHVMKG